MDWFIGLRITLGAQGAVGMEESLSRAVMLLLAALVMHFYSIYNSLATLIH
jgi:hypothetical protein